VKTKIIEALKSEIILAYGTNPQISPDFPRIVNDKNWNRLIQFLDNETILFGGQTKKSEKYIAPTLLDNSKLTSLAMQDEIFGPILPILSYESEKEIDTIILNYEKPLAFYVFSNDIKWAKQMVKRYSFGGVVSMTLSFIFRIIDCLLEELEIVELALITEFQV
jgi:aldehyde dehydrogenase (NAD+)